MLSEEEAGIRVSVTFPKKDAEWLQDQVERGEYTSLAEVVRMCVRTMRAGGPGIVFRPKPGEGITIPTEIAIEAIKNPELITHLLEFLGAGEGERNQLVKQFIERKKNSGSI